MPHYYYYCSDCQKDFPAYRIERDLIYLCPFCGEAEENKPLKGILRIKYDFNSINRVYYEKKLLNSKCGNLGIPRDNAP